jgi:flagellar hook-associated protein 1 FlgK
LGDATIGPVSAANLSGAPLAVDITLTFDAGANQLQVSSPPGGSIAYDPSADSGSALTLNVPGFGDIGFSVRGLPSDGDSFTLEHNDGASGDNGNALLLADLQGAGVLDGGSVSFAEGYHLTVSDIASRTRSYEQASTTQSELLKRAEDSRSSYSGVNLDEEAANIMRYQQSYQASARVIAVANDLFQTLLRSFGG